MWTRQPLLAVLVVIAGAGVWAVPVHAQQAPAQRLGDVVTMLQLPVALLAQQVHPMAPPLPVQEAAPARSYSRKESRPPWIFGVHATTAVMQGLDAHSTFAALDAGGTEVNLAVVPFARHRGAFTALKVGIAAGVIYSTDRLARRHPIRALLVATAINSAYAMVAAHNYKVAGRRAASP